VGHGRAGSRHRRGEQKRVGRRCLDIVHLAGGLQRRRLLRAAAAAGRRLLRAVRRQPGARQVGERAAGTRPGGRGRWHQRPGRGVVVRLTWQLRRGRPLHRQARPLPALRGQPGARQLGHIAAGAGPHGPRRSRRGGEQHLLPGRRPVHRRRLHWRPQPERHHDCRLRGEPELTHAPTPQCSAIARGLSVRSVSMRGPA
jgi:hypothetical protein